MPIAISDFLQKMPGWSVESTGTKPEVLDAGDTIRQPDANGDSRRVDFETAVEAYHQAPEVSEATPARTCIQRMELRVARDTIAKATLDIEKKNREWPSSRRAGRRYSDVLQAASSALTDAAPELSQVAVNAVKRTKALNANPMIKLATLRSYTSELLKLLDEELATPSRSLTSPAEQ